VVAAVDGNPSSMILVDTTEPEGARAVHVLQSDPAGGVVEQKPGPEAQSLADAIALASQQSLAPAGEETIQAQVDGPQGSSRIVPAFVRRIE
jgi:hypothetical protein